MLPKLSGFDHIHVYVSNREDAASWYEKYLGFKVNKTLEVWAANPHGPLTIEDPSGKIHLALFNSENFIPATVLAMKSDGEGFLAWRAHLEKSNILDRFTDHKIAWSIYFKDLDGNLNEITTYDYDYVAAQLSA